MAFDEETSKEPRDWAKALWAGVVVMVAVMAFLMWWAGRPEPGMSIAYCKHILIAYEATNPADRERAYSLAQRLREQILAGEDFAQLARDYSSDKDSASRGGELPPFRRADKLEPSFAEYAWNAPIGHLSDVVSTSHGFHLVIVTERYVSSEDRYEVELERRAAEALRREQSAGAGAPALPAANTAAIAPNPALEEALP